MKSPGRIKTCLRHRELAPKMSSMTEGPTAHVPSSLAGKRGLDRVTEHVKIAGAALASGAVIAATAVVSVASFVADTFDD